MNYVPPLREHPSVRTEHLGVRILTQHTASSCYGRQGVLSTQVPFTADLGHHVPGFRVLSRQRPPTDEQKGPTTVLAIRPLTCTYLVARAGFDSLWILSCQAAWAGFSFSFLALFLACQRARWRRGLAGWANDLGQVAGLTAWLGRGDDRGRGGSPRLSGPVVAA